MKQPPHWILILSRAKLMQPFFRCQLNLVSTPQAVSGQIYELLFFTLRMVDAITISPDHSTGYVSFSESGPLPPARRGSRQ